MRRVFAATLFDYNGVLVDDELVHLEAFRRVLAPLAIEISEADYFDRYLGYDDAGAFRAILSDAGRAPSESEISAFIELKRPVYVEHARAGLRFFEGAAELVRRRATLGPVAIVSGALRSEIELGLSLLGIAEHVSFVIAAEEAQLSKPDPSGYLLAKERLRRDVGAHAAERALVVEDSLAGVEAAKAAGLACIAVAHSYSHQQLNSAGADLVVASIGALTEEQIADLYHRLYGST
jgi:beta-phosphoglucomutase